MSDTTTLLGIPFFTGTLAEAIERTVRDGGLIVAPSGPGLATLPQAPEYQQAVESSDLALTDSGLLVLLWNVTHKPKIPKISGYLFFREIVNHSALREPGASFWIMPSATDMRINLVWLNQLGIPATEEDCYLAPYYDSSGTVEDATLLGLIEKRRPRFVFNNLGGGTQERLGYSLRKQLSYCPAIICTGAAIAFFTGQQARIPAWVDKCHLGWLARIIAKPRTYLPRYLAALKLIPLFFRYGKNRPTPTT